MDNQDETASFEVAGDGVSTSGISSPQIVLVPRNTLSWGINECSSSFQSVSSCETLESYEPHAITTDSPQVIVVPFLADDEITGTMIPNNGVHIPLIKECSIRIDPIKMTSAHCDVANVEKVIELPFSTDATSDCTTKTPELSDDESSEFEGFGVESIIETEYDRYKEAVRLIKAKAERFAKNRSRCLTEPIVIERDSSEPILTERILTQRHFVERQAPAPDRINKPEIVKRPRPIQRKPLKTQPSDDSIASHNQVRKVDTDVRTQVKLSPSKRNNVVKPVVPKPDRVSSLPVDAKVNKPDSSSDSSDSDSDVIPTPVTPTAPTDTSPRKNKQERSGDVKNNNKEKELRKLEKMRRRKELSMVADRIRDHWREIFAVARRKQRKKEAKRIRIENSRHRGRGEHRRQRKRKRVSCSSDSDSTDSSSSSSSSRTSCSSSSSDSDTNDSDVDTYTSDTSYTSQTTHTRTESDSTDSDSSDLYRRHRSRIKRYRRSPSTTTSVTSATSVTSVTTSSDDDDDDDNDRVYSNRIQLREYRKRSKSRKRKLSESHRSEELPHRKQRKMSVPRVKVIRFDSGKQHRFNHPFRLPPEKVKKTNAEFADLSAIESTSAGDFSVKQCCSK